MIVDVLQIQLKNDAFVNIKKKKFCRSLQVINNFFFFEGPYSSGGQNF